MLIVDVKHHHERARTGRAFGWHTIAASAARRLADPRLRCPECKGAVGLFSSSANGKMPERAEHKSRNPGCTLGDCFDGLKRMASLPIEEDQESYAD
jgi:hypothetical protein